MMLLQLKMIIKSMMILWQSKNVLVHTRFATGRQNIKYQDSKNKDEQQDIAQGS